MKLSRATTTTLIVIAYALPAVGLFRNPHGGYALTLFFRYYEFFIGITLLAFILLKTRFRGAKDRAQISIGIASMIYAQCYTVDLINAAYWSKTITKKCVASELISKSIRDKAVICKFENKDLLQIDISRSSFLKIHEGDTLRYTTRYGLFYPESFIEDPE